MAGQDRLIDALRRGWDAPMRAQFTGGAFMLPASALVVFLLEMAGLSDGALLILIAAAVQFLGTFLIADRLARR